jgi:hypothetical protein
MIRTFTIVENRNNNGNVEYSVNGDMPLEEVARALITVALHTELPKPKQEKEGDSSKPEEG